MNVSDFEQRRNKILELIIEAYVTSALPVGSELVARKLRSSLSPATIRNIMVELEEAGLLEQPHTSAGRVPTDRGYRFYVDSVMEQRRLSPEETHRLEAMIQPPELEADELFDRASAVLSELTHEAAFVVAPTVKGSKVKQVELVPLSVRKILCVLVANEEMVASHVIEIEEPLSRDEAAALARFINTELVGLPFSELLSSLERRMLAEHDAFYHLVKRSFAILQHALSTEPTERLLLDGMSYVMSQPEFRDPLKAAVLLRGFDEHVALIEQLRQDLSTSGIRIRIGHELQVPGFEECSYVAAPFGIGQTVLGRVGVLGPKRMDYQRMRALVEAMARCLSQSLARWGGE